MARSGLLGKARFEWAEYVTRSMEKQLEGMLEITTSSWLALLALTAATAPIALSPSHAALAWASSGWVILLAAHGVLGLSGQVLRNLVAHGHVLRKKAKFLAERAGAGGSPTLPGGSRVRPTAAGGEVGAAAERGRGRGGRGAGAGGATAADGRGCRRG